MIKASHRYNLNAINPGLSKEWHPTKNGNLSPQNVTPGSGKKVWWICKRGHEWEGMIRDRNRGSGCPYCAGKSVSHDTCLKTINPKLSNQWHPTINGTLTPLDVTPGSNMKVWWICEHGHEWRTAIAHRNKGSGCPYCAGQKVCNNNCLFTINPELSKQWHPTKNGNLTPVDVVAGSRKKAWWICKRGHEWEATIYHRSRGLGCPYCSGQRVCEDNSLQAVNPNLAKEWHPTKNGTLTALDVTSGSGIKVWWICKEGHEWDAVIQSRNKGIGCPYCSGYKHSEDNCLQAVNPNIAKEWHPTKNSSLTPSDVAPGSSKKAWWVCEHGHEWDAAISSRNKGHGCPYCAGQRVFKDNCLETINPILAKEWHPTKNHDLTPKDVTAHANRKIWWICSRGHEWKALISNRSKGRGCPHCHSQNTLAELRIYAEFKVIFQKSELRGKIDGVECDIYFPEINAGIEIDGYYWHKNKYENDKLKADFFKSKGIDLIRLRAKGLKRIGENDIFFSEKNEVEFNLIKKIYQKLLRLKDFNKDIKSKIKSYINKEKFQNNREYKSILNKLPSPIKELSLEYCNKNLASQWHSSKNGTLTPLDVTPGSQKKVWWICEHEHEWPATVASRTAGNGCPYCAGQMVCKDNCLYNKPELSKEWHPTKNGKLTPKDVTQSSSIKVWWHCKYGHEWKAPIYSRKAGQGCPYCSGKRTNAENCLQNLKPLIAEQWHPIKNGSLTPKDVTPMSGRKVWWLCEKGHDWEDTIDHRSVGRGCPYCSGRRVCEDNCLQTINPNLAKEWHPTKNGELSPKNVELSASRS